MAPMLAGFVAAALVFLLALLVVLARRKRRPVERGYCLLADVVLLAVTAALLWPWLAFGIWVPMLVRHRSPRPC